MFVDMTFRGANFLSESFGHKIRIDWLNQWTFSAATLNSIVSNTVARMDAQGENAS